MFQLSSRSFFNRIKKLNKNILTAAIILPVITVTVLGSLSKDFLQARAAGGLSKQGYDTTTQSTTTTKQGGEVKWVNSLNNETTSPAVATITDPIGVNQTYQSGSLQTPPSWSKEYSTDNGGSWSASEPSSGVNAVRSSGLTTPGTSNAIESTIPVPTAPFQTGYAGGDGLYPIVYYSPNGGMDKICQVQHRHSSINCQQAGVAADLPGYPQKMAKTAGGSDYDIFFTANKYDAKIVGTKLYIPGEVSGTEVGKLCWDLAIDASCGFTSFGVVPDPALGDKYYAQPDAGMFLVNGIMSVGTKEYIGLGRYLFCYDTSSNSSCGSVDVGAVAVAGISVDYTASITVQSGSKIYVAGSYSGSRLTCYDAATNAVCDGTWPTTTDQNGFIYPIYNSSGVISGICTLWSHTCNDTLGNPIGEPSYITASVADLLSPSGGDAEAWGTFVYNNKVYYGFETTQVYPTQRPSRTVCVDIPTQTLCPNFTAGGISSIPGSILWDDTPAGRVVVYGYNEYKGCMIGLGHNALLWTFDPETGVTPCPGKAKVNFNASVQDQFFCDGDRKSVG